MNQQEIIERAIAENRNSYLVLDRYDPDIDNIPYPCYDILNSEYPVSYELIGTHKPLLEKLSDFNHMYCCDLSITNSFRFSPGYIEKIKEAMAVNMFPRFNMKSTRLPLRLEYTRHRYQNMTEKLKVIDVMLAELRRQKKTLKGAKDDSQEIYKDFIEKFINSGAYEYFDDIFISTKGAGVEQRYYRHSMTTHNANDPFVCMVKDFEDVNIIATTDNGIVAVIPWGTLSLCFEIDLYHWVNSYEAPRYVKPAGRRFAFHCFANKYPYYHGIEHPYILSNRRGGDRFYGPGNVCFGEMDMDIRDSMHIMDWEILDQQLNGWMTGFHMGHTSPLNNFNTCKIGILSSYTDGITNPEYGQRYLNENGYVFEDTCKKVFRHDMTDDSPWNPVEFRQTFCDKCSYVESCGFFAQELDPENENLLEILIAYIQEELPWTLDSFFATAPEIRLNSDILGYEVSYLLRQFKSYKAEVTVGENTQYSYRLSNAMLDFFHKVYVLYKLKSKRSGYSNQNDNKDVYPEVSMWQFVNDCELANYNTQDLTNWIHRETEYLKERKRQDAAIEAATNQPDVEDDIEISTNIEDPSPEYVEMLRDIARRDNL